MWASQCGHFHSARIYSALRKIMKYLILPPVQSANVIISKYNTPFYDRTLVKEQSSANADYAVLRKKRCPLGSSLYWRPSRPCKSNKHSLIPYCIDLRVRNYFSSCGRIIFSPVVACLRQAPFRFWNYVAYYVDMTTWQIARRNYIIALYRKLYAKKWWMLWREMLRNRKYSMDLNTSDLRNRWLFFWHFSIFRDKNESN